MKSYFKDVLSFLQVGQEMQESFFDPDTSRTTALLKKESFPKSGQIEFCAIYWLGNGGDFAGKEMALDLITSRGGFFMVLNTLAYQTDQEITLHSDSGVIIARGLKACLETIDTLTGGFFTQERDKPLSTAWEIRFLCSFDEEGDEVLNFDMDRGKYNSFWDQNEVVLRVNL